MPAIERGLPIIGHLPEQLREMLGKRLREVAGLALIALASASAAALATWNVQDPSLSHATSGTVRNVLGFTGAAGADLLIQLFGLGSIALILCLAVWGWRLLTHRLFDREIMRAAMWLLAAAFAAGFASCMPRTGAWPLPTGLGGVVGDAFLRLPAALFGPLGGLWRLVLGVIFAAITLACFVFASGYGSREREVPRKAKRAKRRVEEIEEDEEEDDGNDR